MYVNSIRTEGSLTRKIELYRRLWITKLYIENALTPYVIGGKEANRTLLFKFVSNGALAAI